MCALLPFTDGTKHRHYSCACAPPSRSPGGGNVRHRSSVSRPAHQRSKQVVGPGAPRCMGAARKQRGQRWGVFLVISGASVRGRQLKRRTRSWNASGANGEAPLRPGRIATRHHSESDLSLVAVAARRRNTTRGGVHTRTKRVAGWKGGIGAGRGKAFEKR